MIVDSLSETYQNSSSAIYLSDNNLVGQSFTPNNDVILNFVRFFLNKTGTPPGYCRAKVYAHTGTYGTNSLPGTLLATSDDFNASLLSTTLSLITFTFSGANRISLVNGTHYIVCVEYLSGSVSNRINIGTCNSNQHSGNFVQFHSMWLSSATSDTPFYVDGVSLITYTQTINESISYSCTDNKSIAKFLNEVSNFLDNPNKGISRAINETLLWTEVLNINRFLNVILHEILNFSENFAFNAGFRFFPQARKSAILTPQDRKPDDWEIQDRKSATFNFQIQNTENWTPQDRKNSNFR